MYVSVSRCVCHVRPNIVVNVGVVNISSEVRPHGNVSLYRGPLYRSTEHGNFNEENEWSIQ